jgi:hypothetical protein
VSSPTSITGITNGVLYHYNPAAAIYECPDASPVNGHFPVRMVSMVTRFGGADTADATEYGVWDSSTSDLGAANPKRKKLAEINNPGPSEGMVFVDESENTADDCISGVNWTIWRNSPTVRHDRGAAFAFADSHDERWGWQGLNTEQGQFGTPQSAASMKDLQRVLDAIALP